MADIKVAIVDDHTLMRSGLKLMLTNQKEVEVVGEAADGLEAMSLLERTRPDIVLMDISMPGMSGLDCLKAIGEKYPHIKVILLTMHEDAQYLREGLANGAKGYILKKAADDVLYQAIRTVATGEVFLQASLTNLLFAQEKKQEKEKPVELNRPLSEQEKRVLILIAMGYSNSEIADQIDIKVRTVETYKYRIMEKLDMNKRSDLVKYAIKQGLMNGE